MRFDADLTAGVESTLPRYNVAPTQTVAVVVERQAEDGTRERTVEAMRWGLVPFWSKDATGAARMINARSETIAEKPAFKGLLKRRRCIIPADGFYEWKADPAGAKLPKQPFHFHLATDEIYGFAGLWDTWTPKDGSPMMSSCTIITTAPNPLVAPVHDRMPVILRPEDEGEWLGPEGDILPLLATLDTYPADLMAAVPVSTSVNRVAFDDASLIERIALPVNSA